VEALINKAIAIPSLDENIDLAAQAFTTLGGSGGGGGGGVILLPREWPHIAMVNIDDRKLDVYLLVTTMSDDKIMFCIR